MNMNVFVERISSRHDFLWKKIQGSCQCDFGMAWVRAAMLRLPHARHIQPRSAVLDDGRMPEVGHRPGRSMLPITPDTKFENWYLLKSVSLT